MTTIHDVLKWDTGRGWLVLSGGNDSLSTVRALALQRVGLDGRAAYIGLSDDAGDEILDDMEDLGAPTGYLVNVVTQNDEMILEDLEDVGIIVVEGDEPSEAIKGALQGAALQGMERAAALGAVVLMEDAAAAVMGAQYLNSRGDIVEGFDWLENALIVPDTLTPTAIEAVQQTIDTQPHMIAIGIGRGSALVLGPDGVIEVWGKGEVKIILGRDYIQT